MTARPPGVAVLVYNYDAQGGMERQAARLAEGLAASGAQVTVVTTVVLPDRRPRREQIRGVHVIRVPLRWWTFEGAPRLFEARAAWALFRRRRLVDVLYAVHAKTGSHAIEVARVLERPVLVKLACAGEHGDFASLEREPDSRRLRRNVREADRVLCLSHELEGEALAAGLDRERFVRVTNGVDLARFSPEGPTAPLPELAPLEGRKLVLFVGRLDRQKRLDVLLRAFGQISREFEGARLALAGTGPLEQELRALARELGLESKVAFLGARDDVPDLLRAADAFVLPSESEGLSNALLEALASGTPAIASDIAANRELVGDGAAVLFPVGDADALAKALARVLSEGELARSLREKGRALAREHELGRVVERHLELFREVASRAGSRHARPARLLRLWLVALVVTLRAIVRQALFKIGVRSSS